ncbi:hypothetical protein GCM10027429_22060 [Marivirga atlantica]|jgi:hypothetical protein|uniref:DUF481 domain-containing protein n=1 Tax=Marivirga atlantica TaxID=1548457 RepID=A0A937ALM9_9BACT|nr:DUF481 domain-containing protein [Marivirga atlantica]MBL0765823.1 DUF481 domain-containing protein [Marivirga atlantica]
MNYFLRITILSLFIISSSQAQVNITAESGAAFNGYNDVQYPNGDTDRGSRFSLTDDFEPTQLAIYARFELSWTISQKHTIELTAAPLAFEYEKSNPRPIEFGDNIYGANTADITARYEFNTYRASYRYRFIDTDKWQLAAGATVLIRDARIAVSDDNTNDETTNLGAVPLLSFDVQYNCSEHLDFLLKGDALAAPQGRAEDVLLGLRYHFIPEKLKLRAGYRIIEGGADNSQVYNFSLIHFASVGLSYQF